MKVIVLAHNLRYGGGIGLGYSVIQNIQKFASDHEYFFVVPDIPEYRELACGQNKILFCTHKNFLSRFLFNFFKLPMILRAYHPDFILNLGSFGLQKTTLRQAAMILRAHSMYPEYHSKSFLARLRTFLEESRIRGTLPYVQFVLCQTETMRKRFLQKYNYQGEVITFPPVFLDYSSEGTKITGISLDKKYAGHFKLLFLSAYYEHKNLERVVELFRKYQNALRGVAVFITISGAQGSRARKLLQSINAYKLQESVVNLGPLHHSQLASYYQSFNALFFPTLLESFSMAYLESMKFCLPILTSDLDFAREICGDAALYFNPHSLESMRDVILTLKDNAGLNVTLAEKGMAKLASYPSAKDAILSLVRKMGQILRQ